jgi:hypothetical protein
MKKPSINPKSIIAFIFILFLTFCAVEVYQFFRDSQLRIVKDIRSSDSILLQNEFGIDLPPEAEITRLGYCSDEIVIRIEGVEDLNSFLVDSLHLELNPEESKDLTDHIYKYIDDEKSLTKDMYGKERYTSGFYFSEYQTNPIDYYPRTSFFLMDGKIVVEISKRNTTTENRTNIKKIIDR